MVMRGRCFVEGQLADSPGRKVWWQLKHIITEQKDNVEESGVGDGEREREGGETNKQLVKENESI